MEHPVDFYSDINYSVLEKMSSLPDDIWDQNVPDYNIIPEKSWAYVEKEASGEYVKRFPIDSKTSVKLSMCYLEANKPYMKKEVYDRTKNIIYKAAAAMSVDTKKSAAVKTEVPEAKVVGPKTTDAIEQEWKALILGQLNSTSKEDIIGAMQKFDHYYEKLNPRDAFEVAKKIIKKANSLSISVAKTSKLYKYKMVDESVLSKNASVVIKMRKPYYNDELKKLAFELIDSIPEMAPIESANALYEMDKIAGIINYNGEIPDPFTSIFGKSSWGWISRHKEAKLVKESSDKLSAYFNDDFVKVAMQDVMTAYKMLGPQGRSAFRKILDKVDFSKQGT